MKYLLTIAAIAAIILVSGSSCSKVDWKQWWGQHPHLPECDVAAYRLTIYDDIGHPFLFTKVYNASGRQLQQIDASFFNVRPPGDLLHYRLHVVLKGSTLYLINLDPPRDTVMTVQLNKKGLPESASGIEELGNYLFSYLNGRLHTVTWNDNIHYTCEYDAAGNILSISYPSTDGIRDGYFYEYDYSRKAKQQFYLDEVRKLDNGFTLLQYLGLFPDLNPVNLRTHVRNGFETGPAPVWDRYLVNHQLDKQGKLLQYDVASYYNGQYHVDFQAVLTWNCR